MRGEIRINKDKLAGLFEKIDRELKGYTRRINVYCIGGTALTLGKEKYGSKDMDAVVSREDFRVLSGIVAELEREGIRFDLFPEGEFVEYFLPYDFKDKSREVLSLRNLDVYVISEIDLILTKALAGRVRDYDEIRGLLKNVSKEDILKRFSQFRIKEGKREQLEEKIRKLVREFYP